MEEILKLIDGLEDSEVKSKLTDRLNREIQKVNALKSELKSKDESIKKLDSEVINLGELNEILKETFNTNDIYEIKSQIEKVANSENIDIKQIELKDKEISRLQRELDKSLNSLSELEKERATIVSDRDNLIKSSELDRVLGDKKLFDKELVKSALLSKTLLEDGEVKFLDDGLAIPLKDGVELILEANPNWLIGNSGGSGAGVNGKGTNFISRSQIANMSQIEYNKIADKIISGEIKIK